MEEKIVVRDLRNGSWFWVNTAVLECPHISHIDKSVYGALATFAGNERIYPSYDTLAGRCAASVRAVKNAVKRLVEVGLVSIVLGGGRGHANEYILLKATKGCTACTVSVKGARDDRERVHGVHPNKIRELNKNTASPKTARGVSTKTPPMYRHDDRKFTDDGYPKVDLDTQERIHPSLKTNHSKAMWDLLRWAEEERGAKFHYKFIPRQFAAIKTMKEIGITRAETIKERWLELSREPFFRKNGIDFTSVAASFSKKPPEL